MKFKLLFVLIFSYVLCDDDGPAFLPELTIETCDCTAEVSKKIYTKNELTITPNPAILFDPLYVWFSYYLEFTEALKSKLISTNYTWDNFYNEESINFTISVPLLCEQFGFECIYKNYYKCAQGMHSEELCRMIFDKIMNGGTLTGFASKSFENIMNSGHFEPLWKIIIGILQKYSLKGRLLVSFPKIPTAFCMDIDIKVKTSKYVKDNYLKRNAELCMQPTSSQCTTAGRTIACLNGGTVNAYGKCDCPYPYSGLMCQFPCEYGPQNFTSDCTPDSTGHALACGCNLVWYATKCIKRITDKIEISAYSTPDNKAVDMNWTLTNGSFFPNTFAHYEFKIMDGDQTTVRVRDQAMFIEGRESKYHMDKGCNSEGMPDYNGHECYDFTLKAHHRYTMDVWLLMSQVEDDAAPRPKVHLNRVEFSTHTGLPLAPTDVGVLNKSLDDPNGVVLSWKVEASDCKGVIVEYEIKSLLQNTTSLAESFPVNEECTKGTTFQKKIPTGWLVEGQQYGFQVRVRTSIGWGPYSKPIEYTYNQYVPNNSAKGLTVGAIVAISVVSFLVLALTVGLVIGYIYLRRVQKWNQVYEQLLRLKQRFRSRSKMHSPPTFTPPRNPEQEQEQEYEFEGSIDYTETDFEPTPIPQSLAVSGRTTPKFMRYLGSAQDNIESEESGMFSGESNSTSGSPSPMSSGYATPMYAQDDQKHEFANKNDFIRY